VIVEREVAVPMRDGVVLRADVYRPQTGERVPAIVNRTPYDRTSPLIPPAALDPERAVEAGFALVCQDVRGQHGSEGEFYTFGAEGPDGYDTVEWAAAQPWCSGEVGMAGRSYAAAAQWLAAIEAPPHLRAIAPVVIGGDYYDGWIYQGGAFQLGFNLFWTRLITEPRSATRLAELEPLWQHLPLSTVPVAEPAARYYRDWLAHPTDDAYWQALAIDRRYADVLVPALNVGGWYDVFLGGTLENYSRMRQEGGSDAARSGQRLLVGPWAHGTTYGPYPDHSFPRFGGGDRIDLDERQLRWFAHHLRGEPAADEPPVRIFVMGENRWRDEDGWPLARAREVPWYLRAAGALSQQPPGEEEPDVYVYDSSDPAPTVGGPTSLPAPMLKTNSGPLDQRRVERRPDVLVYTSEPLTEAIEVTGPLTVVLYAATSARDTDFVAKLTDVEPDGSSVILAEGVLRTRFREGAEREVLVEPGRPYRYAIDLVATCNVFLPGHRLRVVVTSSSFPRFDRNPNTGHAFGTDGHGDLRAARQTIFHDRERPSRILLPVVPS
jgi:hypothetical protein